MALTRVTNESDDEGWVRRFHPADGRAHRLVLLPHAGGAASFFFPFSAALAEHADVLAIQYPGRQDRRHERLLTSVEELAHGTYQALRPWADRPLVLFGHSMGAVVAFEVARLLERAGDPPAGLIVSGRRPPHVQRAERVHLLDDDRLLEEIRRLSGTDPGVFADADVLRMVMPAIRADYRAVETYRYRPDADGPALACPLSVLTGDSDPRVSVQEAAGWREFTSGPFSFRQFPGGHFYLTPRRDDVVRAITENLDNFALPLAG
ncbi:alpha/beta fold hydrolase [Streptomyces sp. NPDC050095]|uniref:thioesterase II family protein n=1 Tax=unclassified Streptomyces TaxID=2593676 RepID=UPI003434A695